MKTIKLFSFLLLATLMMSTTFIFGQSNNQFSHEKLGENKTGFNGNEFIWSVESMGGIDSVYVIDPETLQEELFVTQRINHPLIIKVNNKDIKSYNKEESFSKYAEAKLQFANTIKEAFLKEVNPQESSISKIVLNNVVINKEGKVIHWDIEYYDDKFQFANESMGLDFFDQYNFILSQILYNTSPVLEVSSIENQTVSFQNFATIFLK